MAGTHRNWVRSCSVFTLLATALLALAPAARGAEFEFKGQKIEYENAEYKEIIDAATGDTLPVLIFRENGWFKPSKTASGRALVVGGGGAGGYGTTSGTNPGGVGVGGGGCEVFDLVQRARKSSASFVFWRFKI